MAHTIIRGGRVLDIDKGTAEPADILIEDDTIREIGPPGIPAPEGATAISADRTFYEAIPGLHDALPEPLRERVAALRLAPGAATLAAVRAALQDWPFDRDRVRPAVAPTIPHHCSDDFILGCVNIARDFDLGLHSHVAESKVQAIAGMRLYGKTLTAHLDELGVLGPQFTVAHGVWLDNDDMARLGDHGASIPPNPGRNMPLGP